MKSWRLCAEHYLKQWSDQDSEFHASFSGNDVACELLGKCAGSIKLLAQCQDVEQPDTSISQRCLASIVSKS